MFSIWSNHWRSHSFSCIRRIRSHKAQGPCMGRPSRPSLRRYCRVSAVVPPEAWSPEKKHWCCTKRGKGCEGTSPPAVDAGYGMVWKRVQAGFSRAECVGQACISMPSCKAYARHIRISSCRSGGSVLEVPDRSSCLGLLLFFWHGGLEEILQGV